VSEDGDADFLVGSAADGFADEVSDGGAPGDGAVTLDAILANLLGNLDAFGEGDDGVLLAEDVALADVGADALDGEGNFRDEDDVRAAGESGVEGDPSGIAAHEFDDHDAVMGFGGGVDAVDGVGGDVDGGVKAEGDVRGREIVVNGLGDSDDVESLGGEIEPDLLGAVAADDDESVEADGLGVLDDLIGEVAHGLIAVIVDAIGEGIAAIGGSEDGSAAGQDSADVVEHEGTALLGPDESVKAVADSDYVKAVLENGSFNGGADHGIETGAVASTGADANFSNLRHSGVPSGISAYFAA